MTWSIYIIFLVIFLILFLGVRFILSTIRLNRKYSKIDNHLEGLPKLKGGDFAFDKMDKMLQEEDIESKVRVREKEWSFKYDDDYVPRKGQLDLDCPREMKTGKSYKVVATIFSKQQKISIETDKRVYKIPVSEIMMCTLKGEAFRITPINNSQSQLVLKKKPANWFWRVSPIKGGTHVLFLCVSILIKSENENTPIDIPVMENVVYVRITPVHEVKVFFKTNWKWIISSIVGSGIVWEILKIVLGK